MEVILFRDKTDPALQDETYVEVKKSGCSLLGRIVRGQNIQGRNVEGCNIRGRIIPVSFRDRQLNLTISYYLHRDNYLQVTFCLLHLEKSKIFCLIVGIEFEFDRI